jgi:hypothetical protein
MARRPQLTAEQRSALFDPPRLPRELVRHYTLSGGDLDLVLRCRGDHNRLGYAVQLAYLRCPGRLLRPEERPPAELVEAIADQLGVPPCLLDPYLAQDQTRRRHAGDLQDRLKLRPFTARHGRTAALMPTALVTDRLVTLVSRRRRDHAHAGTSPATACHGRAIVPGSRHAARSTASSPTISPLTRGAVSMPSPSCGRTGSKAGWRGCVRRRRRPSR